MFFNNNTGLTDYKEKFKIYLEKIKNKTNEFINDFFKGFTFKELIILVVLLSIIAIFLSFITFTIWVRENKPVKVPKVEGSMIIEAIEKLQKLNLNFIIETKYSNNPYGVVLKQIPEYGEMIKDKRHVKLIVSKGPFIKELEDFRHKSLFYVKRKLIELSSILGKKIEIGNIEYKYSDEFKKGEIISQNPPAKTDILLVNKIDLVISKGKFKDVVLVDSYLGLTEEEAKQKILDNGLIPIVVYQPTDKYEEIGVVLGQNIDAGQEVKKGTEIIIYVGAKSTQ